MTQQEISELCVASLANVLRIPRERVETGTKFNRLGLDSAMTVYLQMDLEDKLDLELAPDLFYDHPTVDALSGYLAGKHAARWPTRLPARKRRYLAFTPVITCLLTA